jgi:hypothetical protein
MIARPMPIVGAHRVQPMKAYKKIVTSFMIFRICTTSFARHPMVRDRIRNLVFSAVIGYTSITIESIYFAANTFGGIYG